MKYDPQGYATAYEIGLDAMERINSSGVADFTGLTALLTVAMSATYALAPSQEVATATISQCKTNAKLGSDTLSEWDRKTVALKRELKKQEVEAKSLWPKRSERKQVA